jgi:hypothetical protein
MVILYRETSIVKVATASVSENLLKEGKLINMEPNEIDLEQLNLLSSEASARAY